jgi:Cytochrome c oxidase subunit IV
MKVEARLVLGASLFLGVTCGLYWILVAGYGHVAEYAGVTMLLFGFAAYGLLFGYLYLQYKRRKGIPRPEDRFDAVQADGAGKVGYFPAASIWPAGMGLGMIFGAAGAVWGLWYPIIGAILFFGSAIGWVVEADHGGDPEI